MVSSCKKQPIRLSGRTYIPYDVSGPLGAEEALNKPDSRVLSWERVLGKGGGCCLGFSMRV